MEIKPLVKSLLWVQAPDNHCHIQFRNWYCRVRWAIQLRHLWPLREDIRPGAIFEKNGCSQQGSRSQFFMSRIDRVDNGTKLIFVDMDFDEFGWPGVLLNTWGGQEDIGLDNFEEALWEKVLIRIDVDE